MTATDIQVYRLCDLLAGFIACSIVVFSPWAFGTTQEWSIWTMNSLGYGLGLLTFAKLGLRLVRRYRPPRWCTEAGNRTLKERWLFLGLVLITVVLLLYILVSAINAAARFRQDQLSFEYFRYVKWLPHSLDQSSTLFTFWQYLGLALVFWGLYDWLQGKSDVDLLAERSGTANLFSGRVRLLLWLLCINGGLLALEGLIQRLEGSGRLLFLVKPHVNPGAEAQFGPWAYRANAASYFNLLWPVCVAFWWTLQRYNPRDRVRSHVLLVCAALMAACPIVSTSRGGAFVTVALLVLSVLFLVFSGLFFREGRSPGGKLLLSALLVLFCATALGLGFGLGWKTLKPRLDELSEHYQLREEMYQRAVPMARDYPVFGTGAGTFATVFQLYRFSTDTYWPAQLHNDWLETRITLGTLGFAITLSALALVALRWWLPGSGIYGGRRFVGMTWLAVAGCLVHARWDFPFQIYSILLLFLVLCALLLTFTRRPRRGGNFGDGAAP